MPKVTQKVTQEIVHNRVSAVLRAKDEKVGALTVEECKELIGWQEEPEGEDWGTDFVLKDLYNRKIRLKNNPTNRPFRRPLAKRYESEHLRGKWALNLETIVLDKFGFVLQGQHRLTGLILAEQKRQLNPAKWGKSPLVYETLVGFGVDNSPATANTYDLGARRSLGDVLYRHQQFGKTISEQQQKKISKVLEIAIRLVWLRVGGKQVSFAPHFPHSEALEFYGKHSDILKAVRDIMKLDSPEDYDHCIAHYLSLGYAAALHYLMTSAEGRDKSLEFWGLMASGEGLQKGNPILTLRNELPAPAGSGVQRDRLIGMVIKAWLLWVAGETATKKDIQITFSTRTGTKGELTEFPRIGGIDSEPDVEVELTQKQLIILKALKGHRKEIGYSELTEDTGLTTGPLSSEILEESRSGKVNMYSLVTRGLVTANQYEPENGKKASYQFQLKK